MSPPIYIYCNRPSEGARSLAHALNATRVRGNVLAYPPNALIVNWGCLFIPLTAPTFILNRPEYIPRAQNKLLFFMALKDTGLTPAFTCNPDEATLWLEQGSRVVCRHILTGHSGAGIEIINPGQTLPRCPLYVKYIPKDSEWRVHFFNAQIIDIQRKAKNSRVPHDHINQEIRSHSNGWVYCRNDIEKFGESFLHNLRVHALLIVGHMRQIDFGAIDIMASESYNPKFYTLEVNTAPGLAGRTIQVYANAIKTFASTHQFSPGNSR